MMDKCRYCVWRDDCDIHGLLDEQPDECKPSSSSSPPPPVNNNVNNVKEETDMCSMCVFVGTYEELNNHFEEEHNTVTSRTYPERINGE